MIILIFIRLPVTFNHPAKLRLQVRPALLALPSLAAGLSGSSETESKRRTPRLDAAGLAPRSASVGEVVALGLLRGEVDVQNR